MTPDVVVWLTAVAVLAAVLTVALRREFDRLERERRLAALLADLARKWGEQKRAIGERLLPVMVQVTVDASKFTAAMDRLAKTMREVDAAAEKRIRDKGRR